MEFVKIGSAHKRRHLKKKYIFTVSFLKSTIINFDAVKLQDVFLKLNCLKQKTE